MNEIQSIQTYSNLFISNTFSILTRNDCVGVWNWIFQWASVPFEFYKLHTEMCDSLSHFLTNSKNKDHSSPDTLQMCVCVPLLEFEWIVASSRDQHWTMQLNRNEAFVCCQFHVSQFIAPANLLPIDAYVLHSPLYLYCSDS